MKIREEMCPECGKQDFIIKNTYHDGENLSEYCKCSCGTSFIRQYRHQFSGVIIDGEFYKDGEVIGDDTEEELSAVITVDEDGLDSLRKKFEINNETDLKSAILETISTYLEL